MCIYVRFSFVDASRLPRHFIQTHTMPLNYHENGSYFTHKWMDIAREKKTSAGLHFQLIFLCFWNLFVVTILLLPKANEMWSKWKLLTCWIWKSWCIVIEMKLWLSTDLSLFLMWYSSFELAEMCSYLWSNIFDQIFSE